MRRTPPSLDQEETRVLRSLFELFIVMGRAWGLDPTWCATWEDVRTWLLETTEYFELPEEILSRCAHTLPSFEVLGKEGSKLRQRDSVRSPSGWTS